MIATLAVAVLAALPEVIIADEHRESGDPAEIKITIANKTEEPVKVSFRPSWHAVWFKFHLYDEHGQPATLTRREQEVRRGSSGLVQINPGETAAGYLSPRLDYEIPPGQYLVSVTYYCRVPDRDGWQEVQSNRITKTFLGPPPPAPESGPKYPPRDQEEHPRISVSSAGLPKVVITDEHRKEGNPTEIKIAMTNKTEVTLPISFHWLDHRFWYKFRLFDEQGRPAKLLPAIHSEEPLGNIERLQIKPGATVTGYLSPKAEYQIPPGRYQVEVVYRLGMLGPTYPKEVVSNRITKTFP